MTENTKSLSAEQLKGSVDFALIAIREDEFEAVLKFFPPTSEAKGAHRTYEIADFKTTDKCDYRAAIVRSLEQGHSAAQAAASDAISDLDPTWLVLIGIAGAVPEFEFSLGDVVIANRMIDFSVTAAQADGTTETAHRGAPAHKAVQDFVARLPAIKARLGNWNTPKTLGVRLPSVTIDEDHLSTTDEEWNKKLRETLMARFQPSDNQLRLPIATATPIASGNMLIKNPTILQNWLSTARELKAIEMELPGVYEAARRIGGDVPVLAIRGISDIVGFRRDPAWTDYACKTAASLARVLLEQKPIEPRPKQLNGSGILPTLSMANITLPTNSSNITNNTNIQVFGGTYNHTQNIHPSTSTHNSITHHDDWILRDLLAKHEEEKNQDQSYKALSDELNKFFCKSIRNNSRELDQKLIDGNRDYLIEIAMDAKEKATKKILQLSHFNSAQEVYTYLLTNIRTTFAHAVQSKIKSGSYSPDQIDDIVNSTIISPFLQNLGSSSINIDKDELYGLLYFLTGNCYIDWD